MLSTDHCLVSEFHNNRENVFGRIGINNFLWLFLIFIVTACLSAVFSNKYTPVFYVGSGAKEKRAAYCVVSRLINVCELLIFVISFLIAIDVDVDVLVPFPTNIPKDWKFEVNGILSI